MNDDYIVTIDQPEWELKSRIPGWGADLDPKNRPGVPRDKKPRIGSEHLYPNIEPQHTRPSVFMSNEHGKMPPVFGSTCPPKGLSGVMRKTAFRWSEGRYLHWLTLMAADRVDVVESLFSDLARGHVPNVWKEMGLNSELKYNKAGFAKKVAFIGMGAFAVWGIFRLRGSSRQASLQS